MARLLEHEALTLLAEAQVELPPWHVADSAEAASTAATRIARPVVLKALVPAGGRGKAGLVRVAKDPEEAAGVAMELLGRHLGPFPVRRLLVIERLDIAEEHFVSLTFDPASRGPVLLFSRAGGVDVERHADARMHRRPINVTRGLRSFEGREMAAQAGLRGDVIVQAGRLFERLYRIFCAADARLLEINPLVVTADGRLRPASAVIELDDQALFRHPELAARLSDEAGTGTRPFTPLEQRIREIDEAEPQPGGIRFVEFPNGDIACLVTSGGAALTVFGQLMELGAHPANAFDITPGLNEEKIYLTARALLARPGLRGLIAGGNVKNFTRVDVHVRAIVRALRDEGVDPRLFPVVLRFAGPGIDAARGIAATLPGLELYEDDTSLEASVRRIIELTRTPTS